MDKRVLIPLANGFEDIEAIAVIDVLRRGGVEVVTASIHSTVDVTSAHGVAIKADACFSEVGDDDYDAIILPGGGEGTDNLRNCDALIRRLQRQKDEQRLICAICAAPLVLVEAEVLDENQHITCYPTCQMELDRPWVNEPVVVHDDVITAQGPGTAFLFAFVILEALAGGPVAHKIARGMVTDY